MKKLYRIMYMLLKKTNLDKLLSTKQEYMIDVKSGYTDSNGAPLECRKCGCKNFKQDVKDTLYGHTIMEYAEICTRCGNQVGYWGYGNWMY